MYILGISDSHDAGAALIKDGKIIAAVSEERLCREKFAYGFPFKSIKEVLRIVAIRKEDISHIIKGGLPYPYLYSFYNTRRNGNNRHLPEIKLDEIYNSSLFHRTFINILKKEKFILFRNLTNSKRSAVLIMPVAV